MRKAAAKSLYSVHPGVAMVQKWVAELPEKTGRSLEQWISLVEKSGPSDEQARREWLKNEHKLGTNSAAWIVERAAGKRREQDDPEAYLQAAGKYVEDMFTGKKSGLREIYERLLELGLSLGTEVKACPCKTIVPLYRNHVFAQLKPTTNTRIDLGLALGGRKTPKRVIDTGGLAKKDRITHRIEIASLSDIDQDVKRWLKMAYELDA
ncbi:MAG TPA: DUF5655 domain-containing protein [Terriglobales bacterium]|nr:DUF5655 domain-containing protein [Terriglobales bacterium]